MTKFHVKGLSESRLISYQTSSGTKKKPAKRYKTFEADDTTGKITPVGWTDWDKRRVEGTSGYSFVDDNKGFAGEYTTNFTDMNAAEAKFIDRTQAAQGASNITKDMFVNPDGSTKTISEIYNTLKPLLPGATEDELINQINDMMPQFQGVAREEQAFIQEQYGGAGLDDQYDYNQDGVINLLDVQQAPADQRQKVADLASSGKANLGVSFSESLAGKEAGLAKEGDMYGLQKQAGKAGAAMRGAYSGGMGAGMRAGVSAQAGIAKGFEQTQEKYGLAEERAGLAARKGIYGLEKGAEEKFESQISEWLDPSWFETPASGAKEGGYVHKDGSGVGNNKKSFSAFLTQLPTAGGS